MKLAFVALSLILNGCTTAQNNALKIEDYKAENTTIKTSTVPNSENLNRATSYWGLGNFSAVIPAFDEQGYLMASWTPSTRQNAPTFVIAHGGGGAGAMLFFMGADLKAMTGANILIVDSIWSRGRTSNGGDSVQRSGRTLSSNVRMFDLAAAGKWLASKGVDPKSTYAIGESQGGWGVLRAFTDDTTITKLIKPYYAGAIALYPQCDKVEPQTFVYHRLGPYHSRVMIITGGKDTLTPVSYCSETTLKTAEKWLHWEEATHAFNIDTHGAFRRPMDGVCKSFVNGFGSHQFCYSESRTKQMLREIQTFTQRDITNMN